MKKIFALVLALVFCAGLVPQVVSADAAVTRVKDVAKVQGVRSNQLMGYGLVVGLNDTGDSTSSLETAQSARDVQQKKLSSSPS